MSELSARRRLLEHFHVGDQVRVTYMARHAAYHGKEGIVRKVIRSRAVVEVDVPGLGLYDAYPSNLINLFQGQTPESDRDMLGDEADDLHMVGIDDIGTK